METMGCLGGQLETMLDARPAQSLPKMWTEMLIPPLDMPGTVDRRRTIPILGRAPTKIRVVKAASRQSFVMVFFGGP